jgi:hypothetical protein
MHRPGALVIALTLAVSTFAASSATADEWVNGYTRKEGTQVQPHYRSAPDGNPYNNYSYPGNVNPHTGKRATGNPDTYLRDHDRSFDVMRPRTANQSSGW